jgi:tRNA pseudouridine55 synthase
MNAPRTRVQRRPVHGVLLLDKPLGLSSNQALQKAKWLLRADKAGHTGTLDPLASGVLPLCFGAATKFSQAHLDADKTYETTVALGVRTTTGDAEGEVIERREVTCTLGQVVEALDAHSGQIDQTPPMHSALKKDGKALYEYARQGQTIEREARRVTIHDLELLSASLDGSNPHLNLRVRCSKGTYIRTLGEDIGTHLRCGAHLSRLRRIATGPFEISQCVTLEALEAMNEDQRIAALRPVDVLLADHPVIELDAAQAGRFLSGLRRRGPWHDQAAVRVYGCQPHALLGTAHVKAGELIPTRLLSPLEIEQVLNQTAAPCGMNGNEHEQTNS